MGFRNRATCLGMAVLVAACGGGGGADKPFEPPPAMASLSPSRVDFSATQTDTDAPVTQLTVSLTHSSTGPFLVIGTGTSVVQASASGNVVTVRGVSPANLPPGNYADNVTVNVCLDEQCTRVAANSPLQVPVLYKVLLGDPALMTPRFGTMSPGIVVEGGPGFTLEVQGDNFAPTTAVLWNGQPLATTYVSRTTIQAQVPASDVAAIGHGQVILSNASTGGGVSTSLLLEVVGPTPTLTSLAPSTAVVGGSGYTLIINGTGFSPQTQVTWNGIPRAATYASPTRLAVDVSAADIAAAGSFPVRVYDNVFFQSDALNVTVAPVAALAVTSLSPAFVAVGAPTYAQTVDGTGFGATSVVQWNGSPRPTTLVSTTRLRATVSAADVAGAGSASVTVVNGGTTPVTSNARTLAIGTTSAEATSYYVDPQHDGAMRFNTIVPPSAFPLSPAWSVTLGGQVSYPLIAGGRVFVTVSQPQGDSNLYALGAADGAVAWGPVPLSGRASAAYDHGRLIVLSKPGGHARLNAFDAVTGTPSWARDLSGNDSNYGAPPTAANGVVYVESAGGVAAYDDTSGATLWSGATGGGGTGAPAVSAGGVYVTTPCTTSVFAPATGAPLWGDNTGCSGGGGDPGAYANGVYYSPIFETSGKVFNASTGAALGTFQSMRPPALGASIGYFLQSGHLVALNLADGSNRWTFDGGGNLISTPILVNGYVFESDVAGTLYTLDASTGAVLWQTALGGMVNLSPGDLGAGAAAAGGGLLLLPVGMTLTAYTLSDNP